jgi:hypothetical protein
VERGHPSGVHQVLPGPALQARLLTSEGLCFLLLADLGLGEWWGLVGASHPGPTIQLPVSPTGLLGAPPAMPLLSGPALSTALLQLALQSQSQKVRTVGLPFPVGGLNTQVQPGAGVVGEPQLVHRYSCAGEESPASSPMRVGTQEHASTLRLLCVS